MANPNGQRNEADRQWFQLKKALGLKPQSSSGDLLLSVPQTRLLAEAKYAERILEVGCAGGEITLALAISGKSVYGLDPSPAAIEHCKKHCEGEYKDHFVQAPDLSPPSIKGDFDAVVLCGFLDYQEDPAGALQLAWDRVREDGQLLVALGKHRFWKEHIEELAGSIGDSWGEWPFLVEEDEHFLYLTVRKVVRDTRYLFVTSREIQAAQANDCIWDKRFKSGIWTWARAFQGDVQYMESIKNLDDYDVVHVQLSGEMFDYPRRLKENMKDGQKLVVNPDYSLDLWGGFMRYPDMLWHQIKQADAVFVQEPYAAAFVGKMIGRDVPAIPHPVHTEYFKRAIVPIELRQDAMVIAHKDMRGHLGYYHYNHTDLKVHYSGPMPPASPGHVSLYDQLFPETHEYMAGGQMLSLMASKRICTDAYTYTTTGRVSTELAGLGVPSIGYQSLDAQRHCFPQTTFNEMDLVGIRDCVTRLQEDPLFYQEVSSFAQKAVQAYDFNNSKQRFLAMLENQDVSRSNNPRLGVPEGAKKDGPTVGCEVGNTPAKVEDRQEDSSAGEPVQLRSGCDDDLHSVGGVSESRHEDNPLVAAL